MFVSKQGGDKLVPEGICNPGQIYTVSCGKNNYQDLQGIGMTHKLALPAVITLCSIAL